MMVLNYISLVLNVGCTAGCFIIFILNMFQLIHTGDYGFIGSGAIAFVCTLINIPILIRTMTRIGWLK